jgi:DHA2 family multidrug resistance protein
MAMLNQVVTGQATMIAYNNDFKMMMILSLCAVPLVVLLRSSKPAPGAEPVVVE